MIRNLIIGLVMTFGATGLFAQTIGSDEFRGDGSWKTDGVVKRSSRWSLDLQRGEDGTVTGLITISDSPLFAAGRIRGTLEGNVISGTITDEQGEHVARFSGVLSRTGFRGRYVDRTGESGEWEWEGELPE